MIRVSVDDLKPGMVIASPITDAANRVLLARGQVLTKYYIQRLQDMGINTVSIEDDLGIGEQDSLINEHHLQQTTASVKQAFQKLIKTGRLNIGPLAQQVDSIVDELLRNRDLLLGMADIKNYDDYTYQHSVNVCVLSVMLGIILGYSRPRLRDLGIGAILHDVGKTTVPIAILNKPGRLDPDEMEAIRRHTWEGFNIIRNSQEVSLLSAHIALQHHEWINGEGYPRNLAGSDILEMAQITAVADIYDALVSDRPYRSAYTNQEAIKILEEEKGTHLVPAFVDMLISKINPYPPGSVVILSTGDVGVVIGQKPERPKQPPVRLLFNPGGQPYLPARNIDLYEFDTITVSQVLRHDDASRIIGNYFVCLKGGSIPQRSSQSLS